MAREIDLSIEIGPCRLSIPLNSDIAGKTIEMIEKDYRVKVIELRVTEGKKVLVVSGKLKNIKEVMLAM